MAKLRRGDLQLIARNRIDDVRVLLDAGRFAAAYYLAGYAVECGLKACIARQVEEFEFPDKTRVTLSWSHDLAQLVRTAGLEADQAVRSAADAEFSANWSVVKDWNEGSRYLPWSEQEARDLFTAVTDRDHGVLPWIERHW